MVRKRELGVFRAIYPSGREIEGLRGEFGIVTVPGCGLNPCVDTGDEKAAVLLDPRALVKNAEGETIYNPRDHVESLAPWVQDFLRDNPTWAKG